MVDALGPRAEEGRGKTTISLGELSSKLSRGCPNGETRSGSYRATRLWREVSRGTETSKYPEEKKSADPSAKLGLVPGRVEGRDSPSSGERTGKSLNFGGLVG